MWTDSLKKKLSKKEFMMRFYILEKSSFETIENTVTEARVSTMRTLHVNEFCSRSVFVSPAKA